MGRPEFIGLLASPRFVQAGAAASLANEVSETLTSKVMSVPPGRVSLQSTALLLAEILYPQVPPYAKYDKHHRHHQPQDGYGAYLQSAAPGST